MCVFIASNKQKILYTEWPCRQETEQNLKGRRGEGRRLSGCFVSSASEKFSLSNRSMSLKSDVMPKCCTEVYNVMQKDFKRYHSGSFYLYWCKRPSTCVTQTLQLDKFIPMSAPVLLLLFVPFILSCCIVVRFLLLFLFCCCCAVVVLSDAVFVCYLPDAWCHILCLLWLYISKGCIEMFFRRVAVLS